LARHSRKGKDAPHGGRNNREPSLYDGFDAARQRESLCSIGIRADCGGIVFDELSDFGNEKWVSISFRVDGF
jgi:hypothetical protein